MRLDHIVCLANSYKHDNRCVAGISLVTMQWVRLIGRKVPGCMTRDEARYPDGSTPSLLDVFECELGDECGSRHHPEDICVTARPWRRIRRFGETGDIQALTGALATEPALLHDYGDRINVQTFQNTPARNSLELLEPDDLWWWIREEKGKRRYRASFRLGLDGRIRYDLPVTDPAWLDLLHLLPTGIHPHATLGNRRPQKTLLTASLSEPFEGFHYKLIAGVIELPGES